MKQFSSVPERSVYASINCLIQDINKRFGQIPESLITFLGRFSIATVFWKSGQTKIEGFVLDFIEGTYQFSWPHLSDSAVYLFKEEYHLPLISPEWAALLAAFAEHLFPALLLIGFATRFSAAALLVMTLVIQLFVYPDAYATHGTWAAILLYLMMRGGGVLSIDHWFAHRAQRACSDSKQALAEESL